MVADQEGLPNASTPVKRDELGAPRMQDVVEDLEFARSSYD